VRWEFGYDDLPRETFVWSAWVTDEELGRVALPAALAVRLWRSVGSVPPPLQERLPPWPPPVVYAL
jgi:hypothetical protein